MHISDAELQKKDKAGLGNQPYRIGILPIPGFALMSYSCTVEPLRAANLLSRSKLYEIAHFGEPGRIGSSGAASVKSEYRIGEGPDLDLLLVVAGGDPFAFRDEAVFDWLRRLDRRAVRIGGVSGGAVILAKAGLMAGRRLAVHWEHAAALTEQFPDSLVERRLFVVDRDRVTCGGGTAPLDLMHALVLAHHGSVFARLVSDWFLHTDIRVSSAPQRGGAVERLGVHSSHIQEAVASMESHIGDPLSLTQLALITDVSARHLNRLFDDAFGQSVMSYYRDIRLETARRLIRSTAMRMAEISDATGFGNAGHFSNAYIRHFGVRPLTDRKTTLQSNARHEA